MSSLLILIVAVACTSLITVFSGNTTWERFSFIRASVLSFLILIPLNILWKVFLYPYHLSPLLRADIPQAPPRRKGDSFWRPVEPDYVLQWMDTIPNDGIIRYLDVFNRESVCVTSPQGITEIFQSKHGHYAKRVPILRILRDAVGDGLIVVAGAEHKFQRKNLAPAFNFRVIKDLYPLFWSKSVEMVMLIRRDLAKTSTSASKDSGTIFIDDWAARASLDIIGQAGFGCDFNALSNPETPINTSYRAAFVPNPGLKSFYLLSLMSHPALVKRLPVKSIRQIGAGLQTVDTFIKNLIHRRMSETINEKSAHKDIISAALRTGVFSARQLLDQSKTLLAAGHETSAGAVSWAILSLSLHPEVQTRLRAEIRANLPSPESGIEVTAEMLDRLPYLNAVSKEAMRVHPSIPLIGRVAAEDTELCGVQIKKGTQVMVFPWAINRSKKLWGEDAREFRPERWLEGEHHQTGGADPLANLTFGYGVRMCIGKGFAQAENIALLAALVGSFDFRPLQREEELDIVHGITAKIVGGLKVQVSVVEGW